MPDSSTSRFNVISPHWPRTSGRRSAVTRLRVSRDRRLCPLASTSICDLSVAKASMRSRSMLRICVSVFASASRIGCTKDSIAISRSFKAEEASSC